MKNVSVQAMGVALAAVLLAAPVSIDALLKVACVATANGGDIGRGWNPSFAAKVAYCNGQ